MLKFSYSDLSTERPYAEYAQERTQRRTQTNKDGSYHRNGSIPLSKFVGFDIVWQYLCFDGSFSVMSAHVRQFRADNRHGRGYLRRPRFFRDRSNPLEDMPEEEVFRKYRFQPCTIVYILQTIPDIAAKTQRNNPLF